MVHVTYSISIVRYTYISSAHGTPAGPGPAIMLPVLEYTSSTEFVTTVGTYGKSEITQTYGACWRTLFMSVRPSNHQKNTVLFTHTHTVQYSLAHRSRYKKDMIAKIKQ